MPTLKLQQAAEYANISRSYLYSLLQHGDIMGFKPGRSWIIYQEEMDRWIKDTMEKKRALEKERKARLKPD